MKKFGRSSNNRVVFGLCGGIGEYLNIDPTIIRIAFLAMNFFIPGLVVMYIVAGVIVPLAPEEEITISQEPPKPFMSFESDGFDIKNAQDVEIINEQPKKSADYDEEQYFKESRDDSDFK